MKQECEEQNNTINSQESFNNENNNMIDKEDNNDSECNTRL